MKKNGWERLLPLCLCLFLCVSLCVPCVAAGEAVTDVPAVSGALYVLAAATDMAVSAPAGNEIPLSADAFARSLNLSRVNAVTVLSLPEKAEGELLLGSTRVAAGQTLSADSLDALVFRPAGGDVKTSSFRFLCDSSSVPVLCHLYFTDGENSRPTVGVASALALNRSLHREIPVAGRLTAYDGDGDPVVFEIVSYPQNGTLRLSDRESGRYVYTPGDGFTGTDAFTYVARDLYGNYSPTATVRLRVSAPSTPVTYADMEGNDAYNAALTLTETGVMSGTRLGEQYYFYPEQGVTRVQFLVMAMNAAGITGVPDCETTAFADNDAIPVSMRGYVAAAQKLGYISGSNVRGELCFLPDEEITKAQAAVILQSILCMESRGTAATFSDADAVPVWADDAVCSLYAAGILTDENGKIHPTKKITRADTAEMLAATLEYLK